MKTKEEQILKLKETLNSGIKKNEYVKSIHVEIPTWAYKIYQETKKTHAQIYLKGLLEILDSGREKLTDEQILEMIKQLNKRLTRAKID